jgi:hypothetical protein
MSTLWCAFAPLVFAIIAILIGLAYKQYNPTSNAFAIAYYWCVVFAAIWVIYWLVLAGRIH